MNTYLNIDESEMIITKIIKDHIKKFKTDMDMSVFKDTLMELDKIENGGLSEYDDEIIGKFISKLGKKCPVQISYFIGDKTSMLRGETFGEYMRFIQTLGY